MKLEDIDRLCDEYEKQLQAGKQISAGEFLAFNRVPTEAKLLEELMRVEREYLQNSNSDPQPNAVATDAVYGATELNPSETVGTVIGKYKLLQQIGEGGMGVVYLAEQSAPGAFVFRERWYCVPENRKQTT